MKKFLLLLFIYYYRQCCVFAPFFDRDVAKLCGARFAVMFVNNEANVTGLRREANNPCEHWQCVLSKYALLTSDNDLDDDKYFTHLDKWAALNPEFTSVILNAKISCKQQFRVYLPLTPCEFYQLHGCIRNYVNINCPVIIPTTECNELKKFYDECREFYV